MRYTLLGRSGLRVSELCLGTMTFGEDWGWGASKEVSRAIFERFVEAGGNFIDTSINYTNGTSENFVGDFTSAERDRYVIATKYTLTSTENSDPNVGGNHRKNMRRSVEQSLRNLRSDYIDLLYLHVWDHTTPVDEVLRGLDDLVSQGKVNYLAISDTPAWVVAEANMLAELRGWTRLIALQVPYSLLGRDIERAELLMAKRWEMTVLPWGILSAGLLTGKYASKNAEPKRLNVQSLTPHQQQVVDAVQAIAEESGRSPSQVAINWVRQQHARAEIIPILGARSLAQLEDNLACLEWTLSEEQMQRLDAASRIEYGFPRSFTEGHARQFIFGQTFSQIDHPRGWPAH